MQIFVAGICGTFMAGLALLAREAGIRVRGCDANVYPPMSDQLRAAGIELLEGYLPSHLDPAPDLVVIGNALSRGNPLVERVLDLGIDYVSGPQWLSSAVLRGRHVVAVSGTHGKTTTASMLAWILDSAGHRPGFLIGGIPGDFGISARLGSGRHFVVEADEYDSAFFDKRSKFVHYRPSTLIINNIEYDHADIFPDLASIERQFHHLLRTVPASGCVVHPTGDDTIDRVLGMGCWSRRISFGVDSAAADCVALPVDPAAKRFELRTMAGGEAATVSWAHTGRHNAANAAAAAAAALDLGVPLDVTARALGVFRGVKRRMEWVGEAAGVTVYDDFAHHPTAIATTLEGLRAAPGDGRIIAVIEPRSNTMRLGSHRDRLAECTKAADRVLWFQPAGVDWDMGSVAAGSAVPSSVHASVEELIELLVSERQPGDRVVIMSNGGFQRIHQRLVEALSERVRSR
ncbi:MAG: UDP-N-acetylmuramate:L-alanyl-gamma-D-glutamyl-meso-diaminopimelate ligase [Gammaproteobacteria bacterium]